MRALNPIVAEIPDELVFPEGVETVSPSEPIQIDEGWKRLSTEVREAKLLRLAMQGLNASQAAPIVGCSKELARMIFAKPEFRRKVLGKVNAAFAEVDDGLAGRAKSLHERISDAGERAFEELMGLLDNRDTHPSLKARVAQDLLNRHPEASQRSVVAHERFDPKQLQEAARGAREMDEARKAG